MRPRRCSNLSVVTFALGCWLGGAGCERIGEEPTPPAPPAAPAAVTVPATTNVLKQYSDAVAGIAERARPALVFVSVSKELVQDDPRTGIPGFPHLSPERRVQGVGSGFIVDVEKGVIVTNNHVVEGADEINVKLANGSTSVGKVVGRDPNTDLAVVRLEMKDVAKDGLAELEFGNSDVVRVGEFALALGAPFGLEVTVSSGVVSAIGRGTLGITKLGDFMQTDTAINSGNTGGPLLDADARVIGVNTAIFSQSGGYVGMGFAIPSNLARVVTERLATNGRMDRAHLGASLRTNAIVKGAIVGEVQPEGPAAKAGVQSGDVITAVDGQLVSNGADLMNLIGLIDAGTDVTLVAQRQGKELSFKVKLDRWPAVAH